MEEWRQWLYPLGIIPALAFTARYLIQWLASEKQGKSVVIPLFWHLSIAGNFLCLLHGYIQMQFHVGFVQAINGIISCRNLNMMGPTTQRWKFSSVLLMLFTTLISLPLLFLSSGYLFNETVVWFRLPFGPERDIPFTWHLIGFLGLLLFNGRFWVQWWGVEKHKKSYLGTGFWWMSVAGSVLCLGYFSFIGDVINMVGPLFGIIPSVRNLILARRFDPLKEM